MPNEIFLKIKTLGDLQKLIADGVGESLTLDFKASASLSRDSANVNELCKDVSAFANSAGGQIVYGVAEDKQTKLFSIDSGIADGKITREWIDQTIGSNIQPRLPIVRTDEIKLDGGGRAFVLTIPQTQTGPHQAPDLKYYRRFEMRSVPMQDYEIRDIARRHSAPRLAVQIEFGQGKTTGIIPFPGTEVSTAIRLNVTLHNESDVPANYTRLVLGITSGATYFHTATYQDIGMRDEVGGHRFHCVQKLVGIHDSFPIFREAPLVIEPINLRFQMNIGKDEILVMSRVYTPGFSDKQHWLIKRNYNSLSIQPIILDEEPDG